ncbi:MAG: hypothetical protein WCG47_33310, partial [Dermatophilaceae bacterium]
VHDEPREGSSSTRLARIVDTTAIAEELSTRRLNVMRFGYAFMGVGLVIVKWPVLWRRYVRTPGDALSKPGRYAASTLDSGSRAPTGDFTGR